MSRMGEHAYEQAELDALEAAQHHYQTELLRQVPVYLSWPSTHTATERKTDMNANINTLDSLPFDQLVPGESKFLKRSDVGEDGMVLTIKGFKIDSVKGDEGEEDKIVMHFVEDMKPMILNKTNSNLLAVCTGVRTAGEAKGKQVVVYDDPTISYGGRITGGLRIKKVPGAPKAAPKPAAPVDFNDEVPF